jgi:UDP-3-O-[3-hydroxymyristoyl] glucosamine N-acyltransferase
MLQPVETLPLSLNQLLNLTGGRTIPALSDERALSNEALIQGFASLDEASSGDLSFFSNPRYIDQLRNSKASVILIPAPEAATIARAGCICILVDNPSASFALIAERFAPKPPERQVGIHPSASVHASAKISPSASIGPLCVIEANARVGAHTVVNAHCYVGDHAHIGSHCTLHPRATILHRCEIKDRVIVHSGCVIGSDGFGFEKVEGKHAKIAQLGIVVVENDVEIGANTTIDRARFGRTLIGEGTKIDNLVQIAHNVQIGRHSLIVAQTGISGSTRIGNHVILAGQSGIVGHISIGDGIIVSAQSGISKSLPPEDGALYMGTPAVPAKDYREQMALLRRLPKLQERLKALENLLLDREQ